MKGFIAVTALALLAGCSNFNLFTPAEPTDSWTSWTCDSQAKVLWRYTDASREAVDVRLGGMDIFIAPAGRDAAAAPGHPHQGLDHFGLRVPDLEAAVAELKARGAVFTMEPKLLRPGLRIAFLTGPEDVSIELLQRD